MKALTFAGVALAALLAGAGLASAKTLVYCSEGSPENFTPAINSTGTSFDAARAWARSGRRQPRRLDGSDWSQGFADSASSLAMRVAGSPETATCLSRLFDPATILAPEAGTSSCFANRAHKA